MLTSSLNSSEKILDMSHFFAPFHRFTPEAVPAVFPNTIRTLSTDLTEGGIDAPPFAGLFIQLAGVRLAHLRAPGTHTNRWQTIHCIVHYGLSHKVTGLCGGVVEGMSMGLRINCSGKVRLILEPPETVCPVFWMKRRSSIILVLAPARFLETALQSGIR